MIHSRHIAQQLLQRIETQLAIAELDQDTATGGHR